MRENLSLFFWLRGLRDEMRVRDKSVEFMFRFCLDLSLSEMKAKSEMR